MRRLVFFLCLILTVFSVSEARAEEKTVFFGSAREEITPPVGTPLSGYGKRRGKPSRGVHDPLFARSISLTHEGKSFVFVSADLVLIDARLHDAVLKKAREKVDLDDSRLVLFATHTHSGAGAIGKRFWQKMIGGRYQRKRFNETADRIAKAVTGSLENQTPLSSAEWGEFDAQELVENRMDGKLAYPAKLRVLRFRGKNLQILGQIVFFSAHPTILPASNFNFSGDFPGILTGLLEKESTGSVALFANGASADLRPKGIEADSPAERAERYGEALFKKVRSFSYHPVSLQGEWKAKKERVRLPNVKIRAWKIQVPSFLGNRFFPRKAIFQMVRMGDFLFIALPGEVASEIGYEIESRAQAQGFRPLIIGFANDYMAYVIPRRYYLDRSQYEAQVSFYGKKFDFFFHKTMDRMMAEFLEDAPRRFHARKPGVRITKNGLPVLYLRGTPYEMGYEHGRLMSKEMRTEKKKIYRYLHKKLLVPGFSHLVIRVILGRSWGKMEPYISYDEFMEMRGLADGSGLSLGEVKRLHSIPDLIEFHCANGAYFGPATQGGRLIHIRNLDWVRGLGVHRLAALIFHEPDEGIPYVNIGYYGFIGILSGMNREGISVGQIGADSIDETLRGAPMPFLLKRVLLRAHNLEEAAEIIVKADRTSAFNYVFADTKKNRALAIETTARHAEVFYDNDPKEKNSAYAFPMKGTVLRADPAFDPVIRNLQTASRGDPKKEGLESPEGSSAYDVRYKKQAELVRQKYGWINAQVAREIAQSIAPDSNIQSVIYTYPEFWVANATDELPAAKTEYRAFNYETLSKELKARVEKPEG